MGDLYVAGTMTKRPLKGGVCLWEVSVSGGLTVDADFWQAGIFRCAVSKYLMKSHIFTNLGICDIVKKVMDTRSS